MADLSQYPDSGENFNAFVLGDHVSALDAGRDVDGESLYLMTEALKVLRPSTILRLYHLSETQVGFNACLRLAMCAYAMPDQAERIAAEAAATYPPHLANKADAAWNIILRSAQEAAHPDDQWQSLKSVVQRIVGA